MGDDDEIAALEKRIAAMETVLRAICEMGAVWMSPNMWPAMEALGYDFEQLKAQDRESHSRADKPI